MSQTSGEKSGQPATERAEELLDSMGRRLGFFAALAGRRIQNAAASIREEAERRDQQNTTPGENSREYMSVAVAEEPRILHTIPGRLRVHLPAWSGQEKRKIETHLRQVQGVRKVQANGLTGNILVQYDPAVTSERTILKEVQAF